MKKSIKNKLRIIILTVLVASSIAGCGKRLSEFVTGEIGPILRDRVTANITIADELYNANFISKNNYKKLIEALEKQKETLEGDVKNLNGGDSPLLRAIVYYSPIHGKEIAKYHGNIITDDNGCDWNIAPTKKNGNKYAGVKEPHTPCESGKCSGDQLNLKYYAVINYLMYEKNKWGNSDSTTYSNDKAFYRKDDVEPITIIDPEKEIGEKITKGENGINTLFDYEVWVLKPDILTNDGSGSLDGVFEQVKKSVSKANGGKKDIDIGKLGDYFGPAKDSKGNNIKLIETKKDKHGNPIIPEEFQIIKESKEQKLSGSKNKPGWDLIIKQWNVPTFTLRFIEFDRDAVDRLKELIGMNEGKYVFYTNGSTKRVYLMEYPVSVLKTLKEDSKKANLVTGGVAQSGLGINIYTGKIIKYDSDGNGGWKSTGTPIAELTDPYLNTNSATSNDQPGLSSFIVKGATTTEISHSFINSNGGKAKSAVCGRIILRDYLEGTYAPDFVENENLVVFGRKIRVIFDKWKDTKFKINGTEVPGVTQYTPQWTKEMDAAKFVDSAGVYFEKSPKLKITDFCDIDELGTSDYKSAKVKYIREKGQQATKQDSMVETGVVPTIKDLARESIDSKGGKITVSCLFPGTKIGKNDYNSDSESKQRFYVLAVKNDMFETRLMSDWINSESKTASLEWWNKYLTDNKFTYSLDHQAINEYVTSKYKYEITQNGIVILDLETIKDIQEMFDRDEDIHTMQRIRTWFMIIGWLIIVYSMILMLCWGIDANADIGIKLLEKATFGHWVAVKYEQDIPYNNPSEITYLTGGKMVIKCVILIVAGLCLIYTNIFLVISKIINLFGPFAQEFERIITGMK